MELRKLLAVLLEALKLLGRRECLLAIGFLTLALVILVQISLTASGLLMALFAAFVQWGLMLAISPFMARRLADPGGVHGPIFWTGWVISAVIAVIVNVAAAFGATSLLFKTIIPQVGPDMIPPVLALTGGLAMVAWFIPLVHLNLAARGDRRFAPGALPAALVPARAAWLVGAFVVGVAVVLMRIGLSTLVQSAGLVDSLTATRFMAALVSAIDLVTVLAFANAAANFAQRPRGSQADIFA